MADIPAAYSKFTVRGFIGGSSITVPAEYMYRACPGQSTRLNMLCSYKSSNKDSWLFVASDVPFRYRKSPSV